MNFIEVIPKKYYKFYWTDLPEGLRDDIYEWALQQECCLLDGDGLVRIPMAQWWGKDTEHDTEWVSYICKMAPTDVYYEIIAGRADLYVYIYQ